ncbi:MAG: DUF433 domain-containing protein [Symploca sp. SIO1B1]|nr:DUF433 domain-containing protein [Symploca sp. SIO1C2]NER51386.1 DUF433 domain-containing protein [Symploca sp. SIO1A3]NER97643.1 DUF433 domain-containing protein [Symploca sp. SIO1B1]
MQLEDYFTFLRPDDIRVKGSRVGIEHILDEYVTNGKSPEEIAQLFDTLKLEEIYATILYYLQNRQKVGKYLDDWIAYTTASQEKHDENPPAVVVRLRKLKAEREAAMRVI